MAGKGGISGVAVGMTSIGAFLVWTGIRNVTIVQGIKDLAAGKVPIEGAQVQAVGVAVGQTVNRAAAIVAGGGTGASILAAARREIGKPYVWATEGPNSFDCSGLVYWSLKQAGFKAPRLTAAGYMVWTGAVTVPREDMMPGDLVCWAGHIGIAASATTMVEAPNRRSKVREGKIWRAPIPVIRRVKATDASRAAATASQQRQSSAQLGRLG